MGEQTVVSLTTKTITDLGRVIGRELGKALAETPAPAAPEQQLDADPDAPAPVHIEPWQIFDPRRQCITVAYVDDAAQQRWVAIADEPTVPALWRKLYVSRPAS